MDLLTSMVRAIRHRGPDEYGLYRDRRAGLVHARLSLIDLTTGQQPLANEDETSGLFSTARSSTMSSSAETWRRPDTGFRTHSDTEVIVHAYEEWGNGCFPRFNGQWAVALWDNRSHRLTLSRDRIGRQAPVRPRARWTRLVRKRSEGDIRRHDGSA